MSKQRVAGIIGLILLGVYSLIMSATAGTAPYAWVILGAAIGLVVIAAGSAALRLAGLHGDARDLDPSTDAVRRTSSSVALMPLDRQEESS